MINVCDFSKEKMDEFVRAQFFKPIRLMRVYPRKLTKEERDHNFEVDKKAFGSSYRIELDLTTGEMTYEMA